MKKYHYEYAVYTDNLNWGRLHLGTFATRSEAEYRGQTANRGCYIVRKIRVVNANA